MKISSLLREAQKGPTLSLDKDLMQRAMLKFPGYDSQQALSLYIADKAAKLALRSRYLSLRPRRSLSPKRPTFMRVKSSLFAVSRDELAILLEIQEPPDTLLLFFKDG